MTEIAPLLLFMGVLVIFPAVLLSFVRSRGRLAFFVLGLTFCFGLEHVVELGGPDSPALMLPFGGLCLALAAGLGEGLARLRRLIKTAVEGYHTRPS
jgi:hypothetical protein